MRWLYSWVATLAALSFWLTGQSAEAQSIRRDVALTAQSSSGQFLIFGGNNQLATTLPRSNHIVLAPSLTAMSCERVKLSLLTLLAAQDRWKGRICIRLASDKRASSFRLTTLPFADSWEYQLQVPDRVHSREFVSALVKTLLLEMANRTARQRCSEVPYWLAAGLTEEVIANSPVDLVIDAPTRSRFTIPVRSQERTISARSGVYRAIMPLAGAHECLQTNAPLSIEQLSWPETDPQVGVDSAVFRASSQLLVHELLAFRDGPASLQAFIAGLPAHFNWQTAFLKAFHNHFDSLRSLEKWWLLQTSHFTSVTKFQRWEARESWRRLDDVLRAAVQVRTGSNALPAQRFVSLQAALQDLPLAAQESLLSQKIQTLAAMRLSLATNAIPLADQYRAVLASHLQALAHPAAGLPRSAVARPSLRSLTRVTTHQLDALDQQRRREEETAARQPAVAQSEPNAPISGRLGRVP